MNKLVGVGHAVSLFRWIEMYPKKTYIHKYMYMWAIVWAKGMAWKNEVQIEKEIAKATEGKREEKQRDGGLEREKCEGKIAIS